MEPNEDHIYQFAHGNDPWTLELRLEAGVSVTHGRSLCLIYKIYSRKHDAISAITYFGEWDEALQHHTLAW